MANAIRSFTGGLFVGDVSGQANGSDPVTPIEFSTVTPTTTGGVARIWDGSALVDGATWYDGSGGNYSGNEWGLGNLNLSDHAGVVVIGRDTDATSDIVLDSPSRTQIFGFGGDDHIYVDRDLFGDANTIDSSTVTIRNNEQVPTELEFSGVDGRAGVYIHFANRDGTGIDESEKVAGAFREVDADPGFELSFEELTGNPEPVISG